MEVFCLDKAFSSFDAGTEVVQSQCLAIDFDPAAEDEAVDFIALVADETQCYICPAVLVTRDLLPAGRSKFECIVVNVEGKGDVEVVSADGWMRTLCFGGLEVEEADLVPEQRSHVTLQGRQTVGRRVRKAVDSYALREADQSADYNGSGARYLGATERDLDR